MDLRNHPKTPAEWPQVLAINTVYWQNEVAMPEMPEMKMLILRGIAGHYAGRDWPRGALDEPSALEYARRKGYVGQVLNVAGATGRNKPQTLMALAEFRRDETVTALYSTNARFLRACANSWVRTQHEQ